MHFNLHTWAAMAIFVFTYVLISGRKKTWMPIGRPAGALAGAALMVMCGVLSPERAYGTDVISHDTLGLLLGMMILGGYLEEGGFFGYVANTLDRFVTSPRALLVVTTVVAGLLSALLVNDTVCVMFTPLLFTLLQRRNLPVLPYALALGFGANVGCALTLTGNPQNMLVGNLSGIPFVTFLMHMALPVTGAMLVLIALLLRMFRTELSDASTVPPRMEPNVFPRQLWPALLGLAVATIGFLLGKSLAWSALSGAAVVILTRGTDPSTVLAKVDFPLLIFFAGLFVVVGGINSVGLVDAGFKMVEPLLLGANGNSLWQLSWMTLLGSQIFSNVPWVQALGPAIKTLPHAQPLFLSLALSSTLAGNLTPLGSVANLIVLEYARKAGLEVGFRQFLKKGVPVTAATLFTGMLILWIQLYAFNGL